MSSVVRGILLKRTASEIIILPTDAELQQFGGHDGDDVVASTVPPPMDMNRWHRDARLFDADGQLVAVVEDVPGQRIVRLIARVVA